MTTAAFVKRTPFAAHALAAIHGKHPQQLSVPVRGRIDCPRCRGTLNYTLTPSRRATGACTSGGCLSFDQ